MPFQTENRNGTVNHALAPSFGETLLKSTTARERIAGYFVFANRLQRELVPTLVANLPVEHALAAGTGETRPLWQLLHCLQLAAEREEFRRTLAGLDFTKLSSIKEYLDSNHEIDPGHECRNILRAVEQALSGMVPAPPAIAVPQPRADTTTSGAVQIFAPTRTIAGRYLRDIAAHLGYSATWPPTGPIKVGDLGPVRDGFFLPISSLAALGVEVRVRIEAPSDLSYSADVSTSIARTGDGSHRVAITFAKPDAVFFEAAGCRRNSVLNISEIEDEILGRYKAGSWDPDHSLITEVVTADALSVFISGTAPAVIELEVSSPLSQSLTLAAQSGSVRVVHSAGIAFSVIGEAGSTPLFRSARLQRRIFRSPRVS